MSQTQYMDDGEDEQLQSQEQEEEQEEKEQAAAANGEELLFLPGPTQAVAMVYPERSVPHDMPPHSLEPLFKYEEQLAVTEDAAGQAMQAKLQAAHALSSRVVCEYAVDAAQDGGLVATETSALRWLSFEMPGAFAFDRRGFMVQGPPPQSKTHVPGVYHKPGPMTNFPREEVIIGSMSQLAQSDGRLVKGGTPWTIAQSMQVQGAVARINGRVLLGSGLLLSKRTVVAFPGVCQSEAEPIKMSELDLSAAPFADIKCAKTAAVLYTEPFETDYLDLHKQNNEIDQYAVHGWKVEEGAAEPLIPRFALVHRVVGTVGELIALLEAQLDNLRAKESSMLPQALAVAIEGALERIADLKEYEPDVGVNCYAYQLLDETQSISAYSQKLATHNKLMSDATLLNSVKLLIKHKNTVTYTIDWSYKSANEPEPRTAYAKIALPIVPHAVYAHLHQHVDDIKPEPQQPSTPATTTTAADTVTTPVAKKGVKRTGAGVPIGAALTEAAVLEQETPARTVRFTEPVVPPSRIGVSATKTAAAASTKTDVNKTPAPSGTTTKTDANKALTPAAAAFQRLGAPSASAPAKKPTAVKVEDSNGHPTPEPDVKKKRVQEPAAHQTPERTLTQQAVFERLCEMLVNFKSRPDVERFGVWTEIKTTDAAKFASVDHLYPPENMNDALLDAATLLNYIGLADVLPRLLEQERVPAAAAAAPPPVSRRPKVQV